jgi:aspartate carbamoyltransferase catalytic subunit
MTAYQQHRSVLLEQGCDECPRQNLLDQLEIQIKKWQEQGHQILVVGDFNEDKRSNNIQSYFKNLSMHEIILQQHGQSAPNMYINGALPMLEHCY